MRLAGELRLCGVLKGADGQRLEFVAAGEMTRRHFSSAQGDLIKRRLSAEVGVQDLLHRSSGAAALAVSVDDEDNCGRECRHDDDDDPGLVHQLLIVGSNILESYRNHDGTSAGSPARWRSSLVCSKAASTSASPTCRRSRGGR